MNRRSLKNMGQEEAGSDNKLDTMFRFLMETDKVTKLHGAQPHRRCTGFLLSNLMEEDGLVMSSQSDILRISKSFDARLYETKPTDSMATQLFLSSITEVNRTFIAITARSDDLKIRRGRGVDQNLGGVYHQ
eukprot:g36182.t1